MSTLEALFGDLLIGLTQSSAFRWGAAALVAAWIWLVGRAGTPWRVAALLAPFLAAALLEGLDRLVIGPGAGAQNGWLPFYLQSTEAFRRLLALDGALLLLVALALGFLGRFALLLALGIATAVYLRYAIYGAGEVLFSAPVLAWAAAILPSVMIALLAAFGLGTLLRLVVHVRQERGGA